LGSGKFEDFEGSRDVFSDMPELGLDESVFARENGHAAVESGTDQLKPLDEYVSEDEAKRQAAIIAAEESVRQARTHQRHEFAESIRNNEIRRKRRDVQRGLVSMIRSDAEVTAQRLIENGVAPTTILKADRLPEVRQGMFSLLSRARPVVPLLRGWELDSCESFTGGDSYDIYDSKPPRFPNSTRTVYKGGLYLGEDGNLYNYHTSYTSGPDGEKIHERSRLQTMRKVSDNEIFPLDSMEGDDTAGPLKSEDVFMTKGPLILEDGRFQTAPIDYWRKKFAHLLARS
jgi:hypothetical protein